MDRGTWRATVHGNAKSWATNTNFRKGHASGFRLYTGWLKHFEFLVFAQISYSSFVTLCQWTEHTCVSYPFREQWPSFRHWLTVSFLGLLCLFLTVSTGLASKHQKIITDLTKRDWHQQEEKRSSTFSGPLASGSFLDGEKRQTRGSSAFLVNVLSYRTL